MHDKKASEIKVGDRLLARNGKALKNDYRRTNAITVVGIKSDPNPKKVQIFLSFCDARSDKNTQALGAKFSKDEIVSVL